MERFLKKQRLSFSDYFTPRTSKEINYKIDGLSQRKYLKRSAKVADDIYADD